MIKIEICSHSACKPRGGTQADALLALIQASPMISDKALIEIEVIDTGCLGGCRPDNMHNAPFARLNGQLIYDATAQNLLRLILDQLSTVN